VTEEAELIVIAEVQGIEALEPNEDDWNSSLAHLKVIETLKGPELSEVKVPYAANLICPAPPRYAEGETVVAFLAKGEHSWHTVSLSYGTLYPRGDEMEDMGAMVLAAVELQGLPLDGKRMEFRRREWLVQAAALPGTRWHGLYELAPRTDSLRSSYDQSGRSGGPALGRRHRALLAEAFVSAPKMDTTFSMMLRLLYRYDDPRIDLLALETLEGLLAEEEPPWWAQDLLWTVLHRFGDRAPQERMTALGANSWDVTPDQLRGIWSDAKSELDIPDAAAVEVEIVPYIPVGGRTPS